VTVTIRRSGDEVHDKRCIHHVYGLLISHPGDDLFALRLVDDRKAVDVDFPNETTGYCEELAYKLVDFLGPDALQVDPPLDD
jgi:hypothetical protein